MLGRNLNVCFTKLKRPIPQSSAKEPVNHFNSLYDPTEYSTTTSKSNDDFFSSSSLSSDYSDNIINGDSTPPDFATVFASQRFFFSSPGHSKSLVDQVDSNGNDFQEDEPRHEALTKLGIPIATLSQDPYLAFRQSMQEMIDSRTAMNETPDAADWEYLHELLLCYLSLNPKNVHKFIIGAFADLLVTLLSNTQQQRQSGKTDRRY